MKVRTARVLFMLLWAGLGQAGTRAPSLGEEISRIRCTIDDGDYGLALEQVNRALVAFPSEVLLLGVKRDLFLEMGEGDSAFALTKTLMELDPANLPEHRQVALEWGLRSQEKLSILELYGGDNDRAAKDLEALLPKLMEESRSEQSRNAWRELFSERFFSLGVPQQALPLLEALAESGTKQQQKRAIERLSGLYTRQAAQGEVDIETLLINRIASTRSERVRNHLRLLLAQHLVRLSWAGPSRPDRRVLERALGLWEMVIATGTAEQKRQAWIDLSNVYGNLVGLPGDVIDQLYHRFTAGSTTEQERNEWRLLFGELFLRQHRPDLGRALLDTVLSTGRREQRLQAQQHLRELVFSYERTAEVYRRPTGPDLDGVQNRWRTAVRAQKKAIELSSPPKPEQYYQLALMYLGTGKQDTVLSHIQAAIALSTPGSQQDQYRVKLAEVYQSTRQDSLAEWNFLRAFARGTGGREKSAVGEYSDFLVQRDRLSSRRSTMQSRAETAADAVPIERLMEDLAAISPEEVYPESVQSMSLCSKRFFEATSAQEKVETLLELAEVCLRAECPLKMRAALSKAYLLSPGLVQKGATLSEAASLLGCAAYEALAEVLLDEHRDSFISYWSAIGPFRGPDGRLDHEFPPEHEIDFDESYPGEGGEVRWMETVALTTSKVDLGDRLDGGKDLVAYAVTYVCAPESQAVQAKLCGAGVIGMWINGQFAFGDRRPHGAGPVQVATVGLRKGWNEILVKLAGAAADNSFYLRLCDEQERAIEGIEASPTAR